MKTCYKCGLTKELSEFHKKKNRPDGLQSICADCDNKRSRERYAANPEYSKKAVKRAKNRLDKGYMKKYLAYADGKPCVDCGETDMVVLEWDHVRGKKLFDIGTGLKRFSWESVLAELEKCERVCANCHKRRTAKTFNWYKK